MPPDYVPDAPTPVAGVPLDAVAEQFRQAAEAMAADHEVWSAPIPQVPPPSAATGPVAEAAVAPPVRGPNERRPRIAVLRALPGIGDLLCVVPALRAIRAAHAAARVTLVGLPSAAW